MPDFDPTPTPGRPAARGPGRPPDPAGGEWAGDVDPPTVRSATPPAMASRGSTDRRAKGDRPEPMASTPPPLPLPGPGDRIDVFDLEESIGAGGMGAVFRAVDTNLDRQVALKILPPDQAVDPEVVRRYYQEGRAAARLDHENIARVYTIGDDGRYHYIAFEYIEGTTIRHRVEADGPLPVGDAVDYTLQIAAALVHAAGRGVVHRDIKPSNIIVTPQGRAKLVDMGLARRFERGEDSGLTRSGMTLGTFDYISPEQALDPRDVDVRSDLYSLGCTLFHMLSGRPPFPEGTVLQKLLQHKEEPPPDIRKLNPGVPDHLAAILVKMMAKDRDRRYQTSEQLARDLLTVAGPLGVRPAAAEARAWMAPAPGPAPAWARHVVWGVPGLAFLLVLATLAWWGDGPIVPALDPAPPPPIAPTVRRPDPAKPARVAPPPEPEAPREFAVDSREDLFRVLAEAPPRSTIVLSDDGPYDLRGPGSRRLAGLVDVTIKAEVGVRPVVRLPREAGAPVGPPPSALLEVAGGRITFDGLVFLVDGPDVPAAIRADDAEVVIRRCVFRRIGNPAPRSRPAAILVRATARAIAGPPAADRPSSLLVDASEFDGGQAGVIASGPVDIAVRDCTFGPAPADLATIWADNPGPGVPPVDVRIVVAHASVLAGAGPVFRFAGAAPRVRVDESAFGPPTLASPTATLVAIDAPDRLDWRGFDNVYGRIGVYLQPPRSGSPRAPIRSFEAWADDPSTVREWGSIGPDRTPWEERNPVEALASGAPEPTRAFRMALTRPGPARPGARQGPSGPLPPPIFLAAPPAAGLLAGAIAAPPATVGGRTEPARPREVATAPAPPSPRPRVDPAGDEMEEMPVGPPPGRPAEDKPDGPGGPDPVGEFTPMPIDSDRTPVAAAVTEVAIPPKVPEPTPAAQAAGPTVIRTARGFLEALDRPGEGESTLVLASDADWTLPACSPRSGTGWTIRADRGATRPRIRFRPDPAAVPAPGGWPAWLTLGSGTLRLEGVDLILAAADAPRTPARRWAAFAVRQGAAELSLTDCTVTIEGASNRSAVVTLPAGDAGEEPPPGVTPTRIRIKDCLIRAGDDLVDVAAGRRLDLDVDNAAIATGGTLVHGHGLPPGRPAGPIRVDLRKATARLAGGLAQLQSAPGEPELPIANVSARDSILATNDADAPLFRVDGQGDLDQIRDRIHWEGRSVAYHQIGTYRRDQSAHLGVVPNRFDRDYWKVAVGPHEEAPIHGDLKFLAGWDPDRTPWTLRPDDVRLRPDSLAAGLGPDLQHVPEPPAGAMP